MSKKGQPKLDPPLIERKWSHGNEKVTSYGGRAWCIRDLMKAVEDEPVFDLPLALIPLNTHDFSAKDLVEFAQHVLHVNEADLSVPIIMDNRGSVIDGRHRIVKALLEGCYSLPCKRVPNGVLPSHYENT